MNLKKHCPDYEGNYREFWENVDDIYAHRGDDPDGRFLKPLDPAVFEGQTVLDYGCGGGFWGEQLSPHVKKYIGLDVSQRSIDLARKRLPKSKHSNVTLKRVDSLSDYRNAPKIDTLFSFATIWHFPTTGYLIDFLKAVKRLEPQKVILQVRFSEKTVNNKDCPRWSILTNVDDINDQLGYTVNYVSEPNEPSKTQLIVLDRPK
jgi:SAM-dependent methyltransferase